MDKSSSKKTPRRRDDSPQSRRRDKISEELRRLSCQTQPPIRFKDSTLTIKIMNFKEPLNLKEANEHKEWGNAMKEEYESILKNDTSKLTKLPKNKVPMGSK